MGNSSSSSSGRLFRSGNYHKSVTFGKRRVKDGECCAIWDSSGNVRNIIGPKLEWVYMSDVRFLDRYIADQNQYLIVSFSDGRKQHVRGPSSIFLDPVVHKRIVVEEAVSLNAFEAIVVYREVDIDRDSGIDASTTSSSGSASQSEGLSAAVGGGGGGGDQQSPTVAKSVSINHDTGAGGSDDRRVSRRIIRGPTLFIPAANEWVHQFSWHGPANNNKMDDERTLLKDALKLSKLRTLPDQLYYNVNACRTSDDAQLCVKLMIFYQLENLEHMLDSTHDPIGDFANAVSADVIRFTSENTFEEFVKRSGELNDISAFPMLLERAGRIGYRIDKIVFRGYKASDQLQAMHDAAIKGRTKLQLDTRTAEQNQFLENMKLNNQIERSAKECEMVASKRSHELNLKALEHKELLRQREAESQALISKQAEEDKIRIAFYTCLSEKGVDLTKYLCAKERKNEKVLCIETNGAAGGGGDSMIPHIHLQRDM